MTKRLSLIALLFISLLSACSDDDSGPYQCKDCVDQPEANAAYNSSAAGIYKGAVVGSSGTIKFDFANSSTTIIGVLEIDRKTVTLTTTATLNANGFLGSFTGTLDGAAVAIQVTVSNTGVLTIGTVTIPGHPNPIFSIYKEKSNQIVKVFEGTYSGDDSGIFNMVIRFNENGSGAWYAISRRSAEITDSFFQGEVSAEGVMVGGGGKVVVAGSLEGDVISGEWEDTDDLSGSWRGKRTL